MLALALRPRWWAWHLALVCVLVAFGALGWWQLRSFDAGAAPAPRPGAGVVDLARVSAPGGRLDAADLGRRVRAVGRWDAAGQRVVPGRLRDGQPGAWVVTPLRVADGVLPVVRGWVPAPGAAPAPPPGTVTVTAVLARSETEADATAAAGTVRTGELPYVATVTLLAALPYDPDELHDGFAVLRAQQPPGGAAPALVRPPERAAGEAVGRWRNLAYGLQWWLFGGAAVVLWAAVLSRAAQAVPDEPATGPPGPLAAPRRTT